MNEQEQEQEQWINMIMTSIPTDVMDQIKDLKVVRAVFAAGPSYVAGKIEKFEVPVSKEVALTWLFRYRGSIKIGSLHFENGSTLYLYRDRFHCFKTKEEMR